MSKFEACSCTRKRPVVFCSIYFFALIMIEHNYMIVLNKTGTTTAIYN